MKLVSIIIPTFNRATIVHRAIKSVLSQTYSNIEVIVVDDGSEDITSEVISAISDKRVKYIRFDVNQGISVARNRGISEAKGEFIGFLDSDDEFLPEKIAKQVNLLEKVSKDVGMVFTNYTEIGKKKNLVVGEYVPSGYIADENSFPATIAAAPSSWLLRCSALKKIGYFDEDLKTLEDLDVFARAMKHFRIYFLNEALGIKHVFSSASGSVPTQYAEVTHKRILQKWLPQMKKDRRYLGQFYTMMAKDLLKNGKKQEAQKFLKMCFKNCPGNSNAVRLYIKSFFRNKGKKIQKQVKSRDWINNWIRQFIKPLSLVINWILEKQKVFVIYRVSKSIGDQVCMSAAIKLIKTQYHFKIIVISSMSKIFDYNPNVWLNVSLDMAPRWFVRSFLFWLDNCGGYGQIEKFMFKNVNELSYEDYMRSTKTTMHMVEAHSRHFVFPLKYQNIRCEMVFHGSELKKLNSLFLLPKKYAVIQSEGNKSYTPNKEWGIEKFQEIIDKTPHIQWVQIGLEKDKKLSGVIDLSGKTTNIRQLGFIIHRAEFIVCLEGLYNHIATAVDTTSYVIFSGFLPVELAKYSTTIPLVRKPQVTCSPCWLDEYCPVEGKPCMNAVTPQLVVEKITGHACVSS